MLKTFKQYLIETTGNGNYVCIDCSDLSHFFDQIHVQEPVTGISPPNGDYHCTLIYSKDSDVNSDRVMDHLNGTFKWDKQTLEAKVVHAECFDSLPEEGVRDEAKSCIVLELEQPELNKMNQFLVNLGLKHSYPEYKPHVTLRYNMSVEEAHYYKDKINGCLVNYKVYLNKFKSQPINKNYV